MLHSLKTLVKCPAPPNLGDTFNLERGRVDGVVFWSKSVIKKKEFAESGKSEFFFFVSLCFPFWSIQEKIYDVLVL